MATSRKKPRSKTPSAKKSQRPTRKINQGRGRSVASAKRGKVVVKSAKKTTKKSRKKPNRKPIGSCFVLMPFKEPFDTYFAAVIKPAITSLRLEPLRGDSLFRPTPIMGDIWEMIQGAKVLLAELTEKNANVFYELGLAHALGKPVVLMSETIEDVPFDLQPLRVILYDKDDPAWGNRVRDAIAAALSETLAEPANAVPPMFRKKVKSQAPEESETLSRLETLERQVASLRLGARIFRPPEPWRRSGEVPLERLERVLRTVRSLSEAVAVANAALRRGVPSEIVKDRVWRYLSPHLASKVIEKLNSGTMIASL